MGKTALRQTLPYVVGLIISGILYNYAQQIDYTPRQGDLGPDFWPKVTIGVMALICLGQQTPGTAETFEKEEEEEVAEKHPWMLGGGIVLVLTYAVVVTTLGFL